jgi:hypothetical protein
MTMNTTMTETALDTVVKKHPIRGLLWGLMFGLGLTLLLVVTKVINLDLITMIIVLAAGTLVGVLWGMFGPAKSPKGPPPMPHDRLAPPPVSRFDDVEPVPVTQPAADVGDAALGQPDAEADLGTGGDTEPA